MWASSLSIAATISWVSLSSSFSTRSSCVRRHVAVVLEALELVPGRPPEIAHRHPALLGLVPDHLDEVLAPLLGQRREAQPDDVAVVGGRDAEVRRLDRLLDAGQGRLVVGRDHEQARLGDAQAGDGPELGLGPVDVHPEVLDEARRGPARPDAAEVGLGVAHRLLHPLAGVAEHHPGELVVHHRISVPISSPASARCRFPGPMRSKTSTGRRLSLQKVIAVRSMTRRSWLTTSMKASSS